MRSKLILWQIRLTDFSSHTVKLPKIKYVQIKNGVKEGSVFLCKEGKVFADFMRGANFL